MRGSRQSRRRIHEQGQPAAHRIDQLRMPHVGLPGTFQDGPQGRASAGAPYQESHMACRADQRRGERHPPRGHHFHVLRHKQSILLVQHPGAWEARRRSPLSPMPNEPRSKAGERSETGAQSPARSAEPRLRGHRSPGEEICRAVDNTRVDGKDVYVSHACFPRRVPGAPEHRHPSNHGIS